jgi:hypothetical protein
LNAEFISNGNIRKHSSCGTGVTVFFAVQFSEDKTEFTKIVQSQEHVLLHAFMNWLW